MIARAVRALVIFLLSFVGVACGDLLNGGNGPPARAAHFVVVVHNTDIGAADTASMCWWEGSSIVGSRDVLMPAGGEARFDLGTVRPDGLQVVATAWNGIVGGPGGAVWQSPEYADAWTFHIAYPSAGSWK